MRSNRGAALLLAGVAFACGPEDALPPDYTAPSPSDGSAAIATADSLYAAGRFTEARTIWTDELRGALSSGDSATAAELMTSLGLAARQLGEYAESRRVGEEALALKLRLDLQSRLFRSYNALGLLAWTEGDHELAMERYTQATAAAVAVGDSLGVAKAAANLAQIHFERGEPNLAREGFLLLRDVTRSLADTLSLGRALVNLAMLDIRAGDPISAIASLEEARSLGRAVEDAAAEENALGQLATAYALLGEPYRAFAALDSALAVAEESGLKSQAAEDVKLLGDLYAEAGDHRRALDHYARAADMTDDLGLVDETANLLRAQGASLRTLGAIDSAFARGSRARQIHAGAGYRDGEMYDLLLLAELSADRSDRDGAARYLREALKIAGGMGTVMPRAQVALSAARAWDRLGDPDAVLRELSENADALSRLGSSQAWEPDALRARAYARKDHMGAAEAAGRRSVALVERARAAYGSPDLRNAVLEARSEVFGDLVVVLLRLGRVDEAFEVADAARGRALLDHLGSARSELVREPDTRGLLRLEELILQIDELMARLDSLEAEVPAVRGVEDPDLQGSRSRLESTRTEYEAVLARIARSPEGTLLGSVSSRLPEIQAGLEPGEVIVEYLTTTDRLQVFAVSPRHVWHRTITIPLEALADAGRLAIDLAAARSTGSEGEPILRALHEILVEPLEEIGALEGARRLIIVPHGPLVYLPFAALRDERGTYLVERYSLLFLGSASAFSTLRQSRKGGKTEGGRRSVVLAPLPDQLPASREEARTVANALGLPEGGVLMGGSATEAALRGSLARPGIVHVATHGVMNPRNPMFSRLNLAPGPTPLGPDDGRFEVREILGLEVGADLVFLSGCETGRAGAWSTGFTRGEDYATLAQAFLYAGAGNVVATLWRISDPAAAEFASLFYRAVASADPVEALAEAQRAMARNPLYRAPFYWAAYQISGSGRM